MSTRFLFRGCPSHRGGTTLVTCVLPQVHLRSYDTDVPSRAIANSDGHKGARASLSAENGAH